MKKLMLLAVVAFACMACNENGANLPNKDKKALKAVTIESLNSIGQKRTKVEKDFSKAGFVQLGIGGLSQVVARTKAKKMPQVKAEENCTYVTYVYDLPENYAKMSEEQAMKWISDRLASGRGYVVATALYYEDALVAVNTSFQAAVSDKINQLYVETSNEMFNVLPKEAQIYHWVGYIGKAEPCEDDDCDDYEPSTDPIEDHTYYVATIAAAESLAATETGYAADEKLAGLYYYALWSNPEEWEKEEMLEEGFAVPYVFGSFTTADYSAMMVTD